MWTTLSEVRIADILQFVRDASRSVDLGLQGAHQAGELGGIARSRLRGALAWEVAEKRSRGGLAERRGAGPQNQLAGFDSPTYLHGGAV